MESGGVERLAHHVNMPAYYSEPHKCMLTPSFPCSPSVWAKLPLPDKTEDYARCFELKGKNALKLKGLNLGGKIEVDRALRAAGFVRGEITNDAGRMFEREKVRAAALKKLGY
jgi:hypothetical protein